MSAPSASLRRILALARPEAPRLAVGTLFLFFAAALGLSYPMLIGRLVDTIQGGAGPEAVDRVALLLLVLFAAMGLATAMRAYLFTVAGEQVVARLRATLFNALVNQEIGFFDAQRTGELTNRLASDTTVLQKAVTVNISMALRYVVTCVGSLAVLFYLSWRLTLVMLTMVPVIAVGAALYGQAIRKISRQVQDALAASTAVAEEALSSIRTVRAFAREDHESRRYEEAVDTSFKLARLRARYGATFQGVIGFAAYGAIAGVLWYGGRLLISGQISIGELTSFVLYTFTLAVSIGTLSTLWEDFSKALGASERIFELMDRRSALPVAPDAARPARLDGRVRFEGVQFTYPARPDHPVLQGLDLALDPGQVVALVGPSGSGKSTVAALLSRFYDPQAGTIQLDDRPLTALDPDWLRSRVGVVSQEPVLFAASISENIRYGRIDATEEEVIAAAQAANPHDFVTDFPEGYDTAGGERGGRLSGGQKQRIAIARALLKDPRILVLDEATSALDAESEHLVQEALDRLMEGRTTLIIAHRLSTVRDADQVAVLAGGRVVQRGTHDELAAVDGLYRRLVERQFAA